VKGIGNHYISNLYKELVNGVDCCLKDYDKIYCVVTFTETGREFNGWYDRNVDYAGWLRAHIRQASDYDNFLSFIEKITVDNVQKSHNKLKTFFAYNFVDNKHHDVFGTRLLNKTWLEVCIEHDNRIIDNSCNFVSPFIFDKIKAVTEIEWSVDKDILKEWLEIQATRATHRLNLLGDARYFCKKYHPNAFSHNLWAEYVYREICKNATS